MRAAILKHRMGGTLPCTDDAAANAQLAADPSALLVGIAPFQQVPIEAAFSGPLRFRNRLIDPRLITADGS